MWIFGKVFPDLRDPDSKNYFRYLVIGWIYAALWVAGIFLVYQKIETTGYWSFFKWSCYVGLQPDVKALFTSFKRYKREKADLSKTLEKDPEWLEEMRKR